MPAQIAVQVRVRNAALQRYRESMPPIVAAYGGRYLVCGGGGRRERLEDTGEAPEIAVVESPTRKQALAWYRAGGYAPWLAMRLVAASCDTVLVDAV